MIEGPEYETIFALGSNCAIGSREAVIKLNWYCDEYGMDTISTGGVLGFVMELFQRGIITASELDGIEPCWGDGPAALSLVEKIAKVEGCGEWLAQGVRHRRTLSRRAAVRHARQRPRNARLPSQRS